jgi:hypothetical protein
MNINLSRLTTKSLATLTQRIINSSKSNNFRIVENHELLLVLIAIYAVYDRVYTKLTFSGKGAEIAAGDRRRDDLFTALKNLLKGIAGVDTLPNHQVAVDLLNVIKIYGMDLQKLNYAEETAQMKKLIEALETEEMQAKLSALNFLPVFVQLKQAQTDFEVLYSEQAEANAELRSLPSATVARKDLEKALRDYLNLLTAMRNIGDWKMLYAEINELVKAAQ